MMWVRLSGVAALSILAGCESIAVSPALFGPASSYGYAQAPAMPQPVAAPTAAAAAVILPVVPDPVEVSSAPVYDERRDPYVTSVLMAPVAAGSISEEGGPRTADGRPILPPTAAPRVIDLGSVRSGLAASAALD